MSYWSFSELRWGRETLVVIPQLAIAILVLACVLRPSKRLPPGPGGLPFIGNLHQLRKAPWFKFMHWTERYGPIFYINVCGQDIVVLGTQEVVSDLLDHRAGNYSDRPVNIVAYELLTGGMGFAFSQHTEMWRKMRRQLLKEPTLLENHLKRADNSLLVSILYGRMPITNSLDPLVQTINSATERALAAAAPGEDLVEYFPWMMKLPKWMCKWRRDAERDYKAYAALFTDFASCIAENIIHNPNNADLSQLEKSWLLGTLYGAGSEATSTHMLWFFVSMILHPEEQKKAQEQIDHVVGRGRPPTFRDIESLYPCYNQGSYAMERHCSIRTSEDDAYNGYFIPKGTVCIVNTWGLNRDKKVYGEDADIFRPERHLGNKLKEDTYSTYGFGRRICVGKHVANNSIFIEVARILLAFNICSNNPPDPDKYIHNGLVIRPDTACTPRYFNVK
ncbi:cytochrome P450 [Cyathus striatus]|nr:cytochrome P450 [Cyathus striatus]